MAAFLLAALLSAMPCAGQEPAPDAAVLRRDAEQRCIPLPVNWRRLATEADRDRISDWRDAWVEAVAQAQGEGHGDAIASEGSLLDPDAGLETPALPPGDYRCRMLKLGSRQPGLVPAFSAGEAAECRVRAQDGRLTFARLGGPQRPIGRLYPDNELRLIFLGTLQLSDEVRAYRYGVDRDRDMIGLVQRIGERRWRLVLPRPAHESLLDVIELVPAR